MRDGARYETKDLSGWYPFALVLSPLAPLALLGVLHRVLWVLHRVLGILNMILGVLRRVLGGPVPS